jgi:hypothetical protein
MQPLVPLGGVAELQKAVNPKLYIFSSDKSPVADGWPSGARCIPAVTPRLHQSGCGLRNSLWSPPVCAVSPLQGPS